MRLIIDIPEYDYEFIREYYEKNDTVESTYSYIYHGTPLEQIRAEIEQLQDEWFKETEGWWCYEKVLQIIDKYTKGGAE